LPSKKPTKGQRKRGGDQEIEKGNAQKRELPQGGLIHSQVKTKLGRRGALKKGNTRVFKVSKKKEKQPFAEQFGLRGGENVLKHVKGKGIRVEDFSPRGRGKDGC